MPDMDEPVNVDLEPDEALRILLGDEPARERQDDEEERSDDT